MEFAVCRGSVSGCSTEHLNFEKPEMEHLIFFRILKGKSSRVKTEKMFWQWLLTNLQLNTTGEVQIMATIIQIPNDDPAFFLASALVSNS